MFEAIFRAIGGLLRELGVPRWVFIAILLPLALIGYLRSLRKWLAFLARLRRATAAYGGRGLFGAFFFRPAVRFVVDGREARISYSGWTSVTCMDFSVAPAGRVWIRCRPFSERERSRFRGETVVTGDARFDPAFVVLAAPARFCRDLLDEDTRRHLETLQSIALECLERKGRGRLDSGDLPVSKLEVALGAKGLRIQFGGRPDGEEVDRTIDAGVALCLQTARLSQPNRFPPA